ncbi:DsbE family thiol:disulfide interchange protein [Aromatoleum anaerobium]|uniref:DsbE family thiol:disulfide interchange protein n=1 Tax=Aromatoleum anaerobium TaxID=182180 RepID=A0ABX1PNV9_9RHOO|nr:DsbE family thiol:disulfide interchange protein [Aromatoleum anaerobium]MCK0505956.1 DsbE family thiol:disulfide interchange protein [Aromatoleum anaerobium]
MKAKFLVPLALFLVLAGFLGYGLQLNPREVPSPLVDKPAPQFRLATLAAADTALGVADMRGEVWLLNVWASWCVSCREEHPVLMELARDKVVPLVGLNYKDTRPEAIAWLEAHGDPYTASVVDADGRVGIDYGVYGVPETFLIDRQGVIRYKHIGPVTREAVRDVLLPKIAELSRAS